MGLLLVGCFLAPRGKEKFSDCLGFLRRKGFLEPGHVQVAFAAPVGARDVP